MDINSLYLEWADRLRKNQSGYISNDEFNRLVDATQDSLYSVYFRQYEANQSVPDGLRNFVKEEVLVVTNGICPFPSDYRHRIEMYGIVGDNEEVLISYLEGNEWGQTLSSPIRKPSLENKVFLHTMGGAGFKIAPFELTRVKMRYLKSPNAAKRAITVVSDIEEYDAANSAPLEWADSTREQLMEIMLMYSGIPLRDPLLIQLLGSNALQTKIV